MRLVSDITFGEAGQVLVFDAPEGRPSSVVKVEVFSYNVEDEGTAELAIAGSPSVEASPDTTTDAAIDATTANRRRIPLTATTGITANRSYLLTGVDQLRELVEVEDVDAADAVIVRHTLHNPYASGSTFQSTRLKATLDANWVADEDNIDTTSGPSPMYRVRWVYVVAGVELVADTYFNLVRYAARSGVTAADLEDVVPGWLAQLPTDHRKDQGKRLIARALESVRLDLYARELDDAAIAESEILDELVIYRTVVGSELAKLMVAVNPNPAKHDAAVKVYQARFEQLVGIALKVMIRNADGAATPPPPPRQLTVR